MNPSAWTRTLGRLGARTAALLAAALAGALSAGCAAPGSASTGAEPGPLVLARQGSFFVGGRDLRSPNLSLLPAYEPAGTVTVDQMYVRFMEPVAAQRPPLVFVHGCCLTGKTWETTPDGRMGWDEFFVRQGWPTYVVDQTARGRSATDATGIVAAKGGRAAPDTLPQVFLAGREGAWAIFRFGPKYPEVFPGMQFPLQAQDEFWKQMVPDWLNAQPTPNPTVPALSRLAQQLGGAVLVSHSQSGVYPFQVAQLSTQGLKGIVSIEPGTCPQPTVDMAPFTGLPILVLWGDYVDQSPRWAPRLKNCRAFVEAVNRAGGRAQNVMLNDVGLPGASHMLMQDRHSLAIGRWLSRWLQAQVGG